MGNYLSIHRNENATINMQWVDNNNNVHDCVHACFWLVDFFYLLSKIFILFYLSVKRNGRIFMAIRSSAEVLTTFVKLLKTCLFWDFFLQNICVTIVLKCYLLI